MFDHVRELEAYERDDRSTRIAEAWVALMQEIDHEIERNTSGSRGFWTLRSRARG